jgi:hypothetical protein
LPSEYPGELDARDDDADAGRGDRGGVAGAKSMVAISSLPGAAVPQAEQNRTLSDSSVPQEEHVDMRFPATVYRDRLKRARIAEH